jgi:acetylornithine/N-succinyldiaminopimelate aminotransferase
MTLLPVYTLLDIELVKGLGSTVWDAEGRAYLDLYGGHAVISIGHAHPHYVQRISEQVSTLGFYSNSVRIRIQEEVAEQLGRMSGYPDHRFFMVNSGAEANENAMKLASFATGRKRIVAFDKAFHGRTSLAVAATDNPRIVAPVNATTNITFVPLNDTTALEAVLADGDVAAVIIEGIQGVAGVRMPTDDFLRDVERLCAAHGALLILDEVQSGSGRTGRYFAHHWAGITPQLITVAKGIGNGFPVGGLLVHPDIAVSEGMLGTTFGGNHLACAAMQAVLDVMASDDLMAHADRVGTWLMERCRALPFVREVRGRGLMIGIELDRPSNTVRTALLERHGILIGNASQPNTLRVLPPLNITEEALHRFVDALVDVCTMEYA